MYFAYGSNLWLHQMSTRCPTATYLGIARLNNYAWLINTRGYANVVEVPKSPSPSSSPSHNDTYSHAVYGLVYTLSPTDESRLDKDEGVPSSYTKGYVSVDFWPSKKSRVVDTTEPLAYTRDNMLVYVDRKRTTVGTPRKEYVHRMNQGIADAVRLGVPEGYVERVLRKFIEESKEEGWKSGRFARKQTGASKDESRVVKR
jgi:gamma-glutamylcyclotransferase